MKNMVSIEREVIKLAKRAGSDPAAGAVAADLYAQLLEMKDDPFERQVTRYNLASVYEAMEDYEQASEVYEENYLLTGDTLSGVRLIRCLLRPNTDLYDEKRALQLCEELDGDLRADLQHVKILLSGLDENRNPVLAAEILNRDLDSICGKHDYPLQPFPEFMAVLVWMGRFYPELVSLPDSNALLSAGLEVLDRRLEMSEASRDDRTLRRVLEKLREEPGLSRK